jgi:hypothetical protein
MVGSGRPSGESTSEAVGRYLLERLESEGVTSQLFYASRVRKEERAALLSEAVGTADLFVLSSPLYIDSLPYLVTLSLERIAARRREIQNPAPCRFLPIINCGFPEAHHTETALQICHAFSRRAKLDWTGGLGLGGGEMIHGRALVEMGRSVRNVTRSLDLVAEALLGDRAIPDEAIRLMAKPLVPASVYTLGGNLRWWRTARRNGVLKHLGARPFKS